MLSKKRNRACSGSVVSGGSARPGMRSRSSDMTCAMSAAPGPISDATSSAPRSLMYARAICTQGQYAGAP